MSGREGIPVEILAQFGKIQTGLANLGNGVDDYGPKDFRDDLRGLQEVCGCLFEDDGRLHDDSASTGTDGS